MKLQRVLKRISAFLLALLLMVCTPVGDYLYVRDVMPVYASGAAMTAFQWIWAAILAACGVTTTDPISIDSIADGVSRWVDSLTDEVHKAEYKLILESIQKASWGIEFNRAHQAVQMVKAFLMLKDGYGTDTGIDNIPISSSPKISDSYGAKYNVNALTDAKVPSSAIYFNSHTYELNGNLYEADFFLDTSVTCRVAGVISNGYVSTYKYDVEFFGTKNIANVYYIVFRNGGYIRTSNDWFLRYSSANVDSFIKSCPFPVYDSMAQVTAYVRDGIVGNPVNDWSPDKSYTQNVPVVSKPAVQSRPIQQAGALRVPATMEEAYAQYVDFTAATTPDEVVTALNPSWDITYGDDTQTGDKDDTYPWVPDITGALNAIKDIITGIASPLTGIEKLIMEIPKILTNIYNGVISIPDQITAFFTIDTAQINTAQAELVAAFKAKFPALYGLSDIFNFSREFTDTIPVISISVPAFLKFAYPNDDRIVIFDLTAYKEWFDFCRNIISAILWIAFVRWLLEQFDVKFGVN